jgi:hypothetical protein
MIVNASIALLFPILDFAIHFTLVFPKGKIEPDGGSQIEINEPSILLNNLGSG